MAQTGKTNFGHYPAPHTYAFVTPMDEASAQTGPRGSLIVRTAGSVGWAATGGCPTSFVGLSLASGQNLASNGAAQCPFFRFEQGQEYIGPLAGTLGTAAIGSAAALSVNSVGIAVITTGTAVSASSTVRIMRPAPGWNFDDVSALVMYVPLDAAIA